jgi:hypothetical protein
MFNGFFHGTAHPELKNLCRISAWVGSNSKLVMRLNSVSDGAKMNVLVDGASVFTQTVTNKDGKWDVNNEYNIDYSVNLTAGKHLIEVRNTGLDWFYLDWIRLENVQPATYANNWIPSPVTVGLKSGAEALVYVVNPAANFPVNATTQIVPPMTNGVIKLNNWPAGSWTAIWNDAKTFAAVAKTTGATTNAVLQLNVPSFSEDLALRIVPENRAAISILSTNENTLSLQLGFPAAAHSRLESSADFTIWRVETPLTFSTQLVSVPFNFAAPSEFFRVVTPE